MTNKQRRCENTRGGQGGTGAAARGQRRISQQEGPQEKRGAEGKGRWWLVSGTERAKAARLETQDLGGQVEGCAVLGDVAIPVRWTP